MVKAALMPVCFVVCCCVFIVCLFFYAVYIYRCIYWVIVAGASSGETKMWAAVRENGEFLHLRFE